ncbi:MAG: hypothetical protein HY784_07230 [Chloroflexi bacterium]|nr:hypothetical protein [Chloroflexota bacterium]
MKQFTATVRRLERLDARRAAVWLDCPAALRPAPGQFFLADAGGTLPQALFPRRLDPDGFCFEADLEAAAAWGAGTRRGLIGPLGSALPPPDPARNLLLLHLTPGPLRLLPAGEVCLARRGAVTLLLSHSDTPLADLPPELEVVRDPPEGQLLETLAWADAILVDAPAPALEGLQQALARARPFAASAPAHALIAPPMPCGVGACDVCALRTRHGWKRACTDGPFFDIGELALEV